MRRSIFEILITHSDTHGLGEVIFSCGHYGRVYLHDLPTYGNCEICDCPCEATIPEVLEVLINQRRDE